MKKFTLSALLLAAMMFIGASSLNASDMKCGAGKCGTAMKCGAAMSKDMKVKGCICKDCNHPNCAAKLDPTKACDCNMKPGMKCGGKKADIPAKKCGNSN